MNTIKILFFLLITVSTGFAQLDDPPPPMGGGMEKIEELEKIKLIEVLGMDEEVMLKFFNRFNNNKTEKGKLFEEKKQLIEKMEGMLKEDSKATEKELNDVIEQVLNKEYEFKTKRKEFINSLKEILTPQQIVKFLVFETKFKHEIREHIFKKLPGRRFRNRR